MKKEDADKVTIYFQCVNEACGVMGSAGVCVGPDWSDMIDDNLKCPVCRGPLKVRGQADARAKTN